MLKFSRDYWTEWKILLYHTLVTWPFSIICLFFSSLIPPDMCTTQATRKRDRNLLYYLSSSISLSQNKHFHLHFFLKAEDISWYYSTSWWLMDLQNSGDNMESKRVGGHNQNVEFARVLWASILNPKRKGIIFSLWRLFS